MGRILNLFILLSAAIALNAQVSDISYQLKLNEATSQYDCYLIINKGSAYSKRQRAQFNAQISIITPANTTFKIVESFMPLENNQYFEGAKPMKWSVSNLLKSSEDQIHFYGITPSLSPTAFYNELNQGDEIKLFSFRVDPMPVCGEGVRLFDNAKDPNSFSRQMAGADFKNGFTMGGVAQLYKENMPVVNALLPTGLVPGVNPVQSGKTIHLVSGDWTNASSYSWSGPKGYVSNLQNPDIKKASKENSGVYTLTVVNENGCKNSQSVMVNVTDNGENPFELLEDKNTSTANDASMLSLRQEETSSSVYPNPTTDNFTLKVAAAKGDKVTVDILDSLGKKVRSSVVNVVADGSAIERRVTNLNLDSGIYVVAVNINNEITSHRLIIVK